MEDKKAKFRDVMIFDSKEEANIHWGKNLNNDGALEIKEIEI
jgi:hypothetical protein